MSFFCNDCARTVRTVKDVRDCQQCTKRGVNKMIEDRHQDADTLTPLMIGMMFAGAESGPVPADPAADTPKVDAGGGDFGGGGTSASFDSGSSDAGGGGGD